MIDDPLTLVVVGGSGGETTSFDLRLLDLSLGRTVRSAVADGDSVVPDGKITMTISHSESKENVNQVTDRAAVRLECRRVLESGDPAVAQATVTMSYPRLGFTEADMVVLLSLLTGTLLGTGTDWAHAKAVLNGEP